MPEVIITLQRQGYRKIIVVDDGSSDDTAQVAVGLGAACLSHSINLGAGAATQTGIEYALSLGAEVIVTMDGDGQHDPRDIDMLLQALAEDSSLDLVIGSRFMEALSYIPFSRRMLNMGGNLMTLLLTGLWVSDSQSGMKAFRAGFARKVDFFFNGYEFCTELFFLIRRTRARFREVPISVVYTSELMRKGQSVRNGFRMVGQFVRYFLS